MNDAAVPEIAHAVLDRALGREWRAAVIVPIEGSSNFVARLELEAGRFALRVPRLGAEVTQVDRRSECLAANASARVGIAPEVIACDPHSGVLVTRWLEGEVWTMRRARERDAIARVAQFLKVLHGCAIPAGVRTVDLRAIIDAYLQRIRSSPAELGVWCQRHRDSALRRLWNAPRAGEALCHCDVHHRNLIEGGSLQLIDWEYSGRVDALFDLAAYASYHELEEAQARHLLASYGARDAIAAGFDDWRWLFEYLWLLWLLATCGPAADSGTPEQAARLVGRLLARE